MSHKTILLVEDNEVNQRLLVLQLSRLGVADVDVVGNGIEALAWLDRHTCELVLADCQMPGMDGYAMTRAIRARALRRRDGGRLPVVALSAGVMDDDKAACRAAGMDDHVSKPTRLDTLRAALETWIALPPARGAGRQP
ncbi:response regulator [uncultured Massilia sp.]|uniref:response regulator n=1 Tax=uncultured Massilia sp. TaxID=169973 RepID=UPI0025CB7BF4|nr:response regulator [uncultured Massilia sp.]